MSALEFAAVFGFSPAKRADAIVVLSGDGEARLNHAIEIMRLGWAPTLVLSGGLEKAPFSLHARTLKRKAIEAGVAPDRIVLEEQSKNTLEQSQHVIVMAGVREWKRLILVASPFHAWRAYLTFVNTIYRLGLHRQIHVIDGTPRLKWQDIPDGADMDRLHLLRDEMRKIEEYRAKGHVASFDDALAYQLYWEQSE